MKHVWILNHYAQQPSSAGGTRHFHLAEHLKEYGWSASIIAASVEHQTGLQRLRNDENHRIEFYKGVPFLWLKTPTYSGNKLWRTLNIATYFLQALRPNITKQLTSPDVIIGSSVHPLAALAGMILARRHRVPFIFEVRDLWPQTLIDMGRLKESSALTWVLRKMELLLYKRAARVVVLLPRAWEYIAPLGISKRKIIWVPNGVDLAMFPQPADPLSSDAFSLMYFGSHGQANGLDNILRAMKLVQESPDGHSISLRMIGDGPLKLALMALSNELSLKNVIFEPPISKNQIPSLAAEAHAFIFNLIDAPVFKYGISSNKLFDYMVTERPIIFSCNSTNNPISEAHAGLTVSADNPKALARAILKIATTPLEERKNMGRSGRNYVEKNHGFAQLSEKLAAVLNEVLAEKHRK
ncbi:glycosyltransferase family 4 protein [Polynucleobacter sp. MG-28-Ekke-A2]|uniref:glycosyltransferase family 4 protein n=1 Tax=Polynucleobacter sp. MG-28-Ekke-A2 TaxID=3108276 RepID=UPI002B228137|nr:glycosyltransferase family 4 protein [Polynucleobacter sp. MG-28-Ekke-A2]MEA9601201.1 glycosyltransferase family 4 protein [Polynucleobacter sp. MG-28-Ekke-A2]